MKAECRLDLATLALENARRFFVSPLTEVVKFQCPIPVLKNP
jgi:hypothetical protein